MREKLTAQFPGLLEMFLGNAYIDYVTAFVIFVGSIAGLILLEKLVLMKIRRISNKTETTLDDFIIFLVDKKLLPVLYVLAFYFSAHQLTLSASVMKLVDVITVIVLVFQVTGLIAAVLLRVLEKYGQHRQSRGETAATKTMSSIVKLTVWSVGVVFALDNLGFDVSAVVAGLGIGGVAVALAAQTILGDLFNYFVIFFDKPFKEGDFIVIDSYMGVIERVGIKSTRIRSLGGELLVFSNSDLTGSRLRNYKRMQERRILFSVGVIYQTASSKMREIPGMIREIIEGVELTRFDRAHFKEFGASSLNIEIVYYVLSPDYNQYMDTQQAINFAIQERFEKEGLEFAYPTQTLFIEKTGAQPS